MIQRHSLWPPSRDAALQRLEEFLPDAGDRYARERNFDVGAAGHRSVSALSPWLRHRVLTEAEVVAAVLQHHTFTDAEKFIQEVFWRSYWKGWLEMRPQVWQRYVHDVESFYQGAHDVVAQCHAITTSSSGIACFDHWCRELTDTGYLHNHARMWFASIWIFTLGLPWQLGADFFLRHLLDGDPASNTLSWRWVGGLQTVGKTYLARPDNIEKFTRGRFSPQGQLVASAPPLTEPPIGDRVDLPVLPELNVDLRTGLLITDEDLAAAQPLMAGVASTDGFSQRLMCPQWLSVASISTSHLRSPGTLSPLVLQFVDGLMDQTLTRVNNRQTPAAVERLHASSHQALVQALINWAEAQQLQQIATAYVPTGPTADVIREARLALHSKGIALVMLQRHWDEIVWPHCSKGFFALKKKLPLLLSELQS